LLKSSFSRFRQRFPLHAHNVETRVLLRQARHLGCTQGQAYYISKLDKIVPRRAYSPMEN
jgi:hypothetical protein